MKNKTRFKSLNVINADERVKQAYQDSDGIWVELNPGWTADSMDAHDIHEDTVGRVLARYRSIEPCRCGDCQRETAALFTDISEILNLPEPEVPPFSITDGETFEITINYIPNSPTKATR